MTTTQRTFVLPVSQRTVLVTTAGVRMARGVDSETIFAQVERGDFAWVWNVAANPQGPMRDLRFWAREIIAPETIAGLDFPAIEAAILGSKQTFRASEVGQILLVDDRTILRFIRSGELAGEIIGRTRHITRHSLERFLSQRLLTVNVNQN